MRAHPHPYVVSIEMPSHDIGPLVQLPDLRSNCDKDSEKALDTERGAMEGHGGSESTWQTMDTSGTEGQAPKEVQKKPT